MNFLEMITAAYEEQQAQQTTDEEISRREDEAKITADLTKKGATENFTVEGRIVTFDHGLILQVVYKHHRFEYRVQGVCDRCDKTCWSDGHSTLAGIGKMYHDFKTDYRHHCLVKPTAPSLEEALIETLKSLVTSMIEE